MTSKSLSTRVEILLATLSILLLCAGVFGQAISGTMVGTVRDASGAVLAGAKVAATNIDTGIENRQ